MLFLMMMMLGTLISISSNSWFSMWIGLEINLLSFIPLMSDNKLMSSESSMKYFLIQALSSMILLFSSLLMMLMYNDMFSILMMFSLLLKLGMIPFHFWFPSVMEGLSWMNVFILMTWQKLTPLILISYIFNMDILMIFIILSSMISSFMAMNQTSLRKFLAFSSINHLTWMISSLLINNIMMFFYFISYVFMSLPIIFYFKMFNISFINQLYSTFFFNKYLKLLIIIMFLSYGSLPPFLGFFPKWLIIMNLVILNQFFIMMILICSSLIFLYLYIRMIFNITMFNFIENNWILFKFLNYKNYLFMIFMSLFSILMILMFPSLYFLL
nr:NADH dehydrogenase subunit 2 [Basilia ansifera]